MANTTKETFRLTQRPLRQVGSGPQAESDQTVSPITYYSADFIQIHALVAIN